jgi:hypothetical protein
MERLAWIFEGVGTGLPAIIAAATFVAYGLAVTRLIGLREWLLSIACAVPVGIATLALAAEVTGILGAQLHIVAQAFIGLVLAAAVGVVQRASRATSFAAAARPDRVVWLGIAIGTLATLAIWL